MKISYIITPSEKIEYLIRCINSLYRQTSKEFEIILAENDFGVEQEKIEAYLTEHKEVKRISKQAVSKIEKIKESLELLEDDTDYMTFLTVDTVVTPITTEVVEKEAFQAELFLATVAYKEKKEYVLSQVSTSSVFEDIGKFGVERIFYGKKAILEFKAEFFEDSTAFELYKYRVLLYENSILFTDKICFYIDANEEYILEDRDVMKQSEEIHYLLSDVLTSENRKAKIYIFNHYFLKYYRLLLSSSITSQEKEFVYESIKKIGLLIQEDCILNKLFEVYMGCTVLEIQKLDAYTYEVYKDSVFKPNNVEKSVAEIKIAIKESCKPQEKVIAGIEEKLLLQDKLFLDIEAINKNLHYLSQTITTSVGQNQMNYIDPINEIPVLFSQGKLGFKVILQSLKAWLGYKFGRKG